MKKLLIIIGVTIGLNTSIVADPIHHAAATGDLATIQAELDKGVDVNLKQQIDGWTPLHRAAWNGSIESVEFLLKKGANVNARNNNAQTPLHYSSRTGFYLIALTLIDNSADINSKDALGNNPLHYAALGHKKDHKDIVELLIAKSADINAKGRRGSTPLHFAADQGRKEIADWLIYKGADVNFKDNDGNTPLYIARTKEIAELLVSKGADTTATNNLGQSVLWSEDQTMSAKPIDLVEYLISEGADANAKDKYGRSIIDYTEFQLAGSRNLELVDILRNKHGARSVEDELREDLSALEEKVSQLSTGTTNPTDEWPRKMWEIDLGMKVIDVGPRVKRGADNALFFDIYFENGNHKYWVTSSGKHYQLEKTSSGQYDLIYVSNDSVVYEADDLITGLFSNNGEVVKRTFKKSGLTDVDYDDPFRPTVQVSWEGTKITGWDFTPPSITAPAPDGGNGSGNETANSRLIIKTAGPDIALATDGKLGGEAELQKSNDLRSWRKLSDVPKEAAEILVTPRERGNEFYRLKKK